MKTATLTALMALLVAIPLMLKKKTDDRNRESAISNDDQRYAIDEFLT